MEDISKGVRFNLGRTAAFATPTAAVASLLGTTCQSSSCIEHLEAAFERLRTRGFQSVQFTAYQDDQRCNMTSTNIVDLQRRGLDDDPCHRFSTPSGSPCRCVSQGGCARCLPRAAKALKCMKPCAACPITEQVSLTRIDGSVMVNPAEAAWKAMTIGMFSSKDDCSNRTYSV